MWLLRVYDSDEELVAEHELEGADWDDLKRMLGFAPSAYVSTPLGVGALQALDANFAQLRAPGRESWHGRDVFLDYDADPDAGSTARQDYAVGYHPVSSRR
jgi:hypothetical protein